MFTGVFDMSPHLYLNGFPVKDYATKSKSTGHGLRSSGWGKAKLVFFLLPLTPAEVVTDCPQHSAA